MGAVAAKLPDFSSMRRRVALYIGFDVLKLSIDWSRKHLTPELEGSFQFHHADLANEIYNPHGSLQARDYQFRAKDGSFDLAFAASLFAQLLEADCQHYLYEIARVLKPAGHALISVHIKPATGLCYSRFEAPIDVEVNYFVGLAARTGLRLKNVRATYAVRKYLFWNASDRVRLRYYNVAGGNYGGDVKTASRLHPVQPKTHTENNARDHGQKPVRLVPRRTAASCTSCHKLRCPTRAIRSCR